MTHFRRVPGSIDYKAKEVIYLLISIRFQLHNYILLLLCTMASLDTATKTETPASLILQRLSQTSFACASLERLSSGTTNFVFRGHLVKPFPIQIGSKSNTVTTVIIKYATDHVPGNTNFALDISRAVSCIPLF